MKKSLFVLALMALPTFAYAQEPRGVWVTASGETKVRIADCGGSLCGTIIWTQKGGTDANNPDEKLRARSLNGVRMVTFAGANNSYKGTLYDYTSGKTYSGNMSMEGNNTMKVAGCVLGVFCRSQTWTRSN